MRRFITLLGAVALVLALSGSAGAITGGVPDASGHPNVGAIVVRDESGEDYWFLCTGSLIGDDEFLTATHCTGWEWWGVDTADVFVTFDADLRAGPGAPAHLIGLDLDDPVDVMPGFWLPPSGAQSRNDVAVLHLTEPADDAYPGIEPVDLPSPMFLSGEASNGGLVGHSFTSVGYGQQSGSFVNKNVPNEWNGLRMATTTPFLGLSKDHLAMLQNRRATGEGGVCIGDSGGPNFYGSAGTANGNLAVSLNVGQGYHDCEAGATTSQRLDLPSVLEFLAPWTD